MDLRIERTRKNIIHAFIELRSKKPLEKITVKELAELAYINKATFYSHYKDIYDLSSQLEYETVSDILASIDNPENLILDPKTSFQHLSTAFISKKQLVDILFSDSRSSLFVSTIDALLKERIYQSYPEHQNDLEFNLKLTFIIQGSFHAFMQYFDTTDKKTLIDIVSDIVHQLAGNYTSDFYRQQ